VWIHLGASIGVVRHTQQPDGKWVSDLNEIRTNITGGTAFASEIRKAFADLPATSFSFETAPGEVANVQAAGYQVFGLISGGRPFPFFHTRLDQMGSVAAGHLAAIGRAAAAAVAAIESK